ncbi:unnamed protein product [Symbiodinium sp. CCMP2456]|nr:unnamed protein product [Symbiodinium sp. CCMP2456]
MPDASVLGSAGGGMGSPPSETQVLSDLTIKTVQDISMGQGDVSVLHHLQSLAKARTEQKQNSTIQHNAEIIKQQVTTIDELNQEISRLLRQKASMGKMPNVPEAVPEEMTLGKAPEGPPAEAMPEMPPPAVPEAMPEMPPSKKMRTHEPKEAHSSKPKEVVCTGENKGDLLRRCITVPQGSVHRDVGYGQGRVSCRDGTTQIHNKSFLRWHHKHKHSG